VRGPLFLLAAFFAACGGAPEAPHPLLGSAAPALEVGEWIQAPPEGTRLEDLRGRVVYLEFWASW